MKFLPLFLFLTIFNACQKQAPTAESLSGRLDAAKAIQNSDVRDSALVELAGDAAKANEAAIVEQALVGMLDPDKKEKAAEDAAHRLAKHGDTTAATKIAKMILSPDRRARVLEGIAKGD